MSTIVPTPRRRPILGLMMSLVAGLALVACGSDDPGTSSSGGASTAPPAEVKLGFFPNVTHAPALVGVAEGTFQKALGDTALKTFTFDAGTEAAEALLAGSLDLTFIGPNPAINAWAKSKGDAVRIVAGSTSGGAFLVIKPEITSAADLKGKKIASPSLGNTQDVALRAWLKEQGYETTPEGGGDVTIIPQKNSTTLDAFKAGEIDGAWVPEPWATRLIDEGGATVLVNERDLWGDTDGEFVTTHLLVRTKFLNEHPDTVKAVIEGLADAIEFIGSDAAKAEQDVADQIGEITGKAPKVELVATTFGNLTFTLDPIAASLQKSADDAIAVGLLDPVDLKGIHDLTLLNEVLTDRGQPELTGL